MRFDECGGHRFVKCKCILIRVIYLYGASKNDSNDSLYGSFLELTRMILKWKYLSSMSFRRLVFTISQFMSDTRKVETTLSCLLLSQQWHAGWLAEGGQPPDPPRRRNQAAHSRACVAAVDDAGEGWLAAWSGVQVSNHWRRCHCPGSDSPGRRCPLICRWCRLRPTWLLLPPAAGLPCIATSWCICS